MIAESAGTFSGGLTPEQTREVRVLVAAAAGVDGIPALGGHVLDGLHDEHGRYLTVRDDQDALIAVAAYRDADPVELVVHPAYRRQGCGRRLVTAGLTASGAVWAHGDLPAARAMAGSLHLQPTRELLQMISPLTTPGAFGPIELPNGVRLRTFRPGQDEEQFLGVNARAFSWHPEQGRLDLPGLRAEMAQDWFDPAGFYLAVDEQDRVLGFHWTKVHGGGQPVGEVYVLGVDPDSPVRRLGRPLTIAGLDHLASAALTTVVLYVEGDNEPALKLYRGLGFRVSRRDVVYRKG